jgi:hypothetical protein
MSGTSNINEVMAEIEKLAIHTSQGSFVKLDDVRRLAGTINPEEEKSDIPARMTPEQARQAVKRDPDIMAQFPRTPQEPGRSVSAQEPQSPSRA